MGKEEEEKGRGVRKRNENRSGEEKLIKMESGVRRGKKGRGVKKRNENRSREGKLRKMESGLRRGKKRERGKEEK